jgi:hypothetical protein
MRRFFDHKVSISFKDTEDDITTLKTMKFTEKDTTINLLMKLGFGPKIEPSDDLTEGYKCGTKNVIVYVNMHNYFHSDVKNILYLGKESLLSKCRESSIFLTVTNHIE